MKKLLTIFIFTLSAFIANAINNVEQVRIGVNGNNTRIVLEAAKNQEIDTKKIFLLANPPRLVIDMPRTNFNANLDQLDLSKYAIAKEVRHGVFNTKTHRMVVDLKQGVNFKSFKIGQTASLGPRFVIDLIPTNTPTYFQPTIKTTSEPITYKKSEVIRTSKEKIVVMIDPGHGGVDPGAVAKIGRGRSVYEKDITLSIAKKLQREINRYPNTVAYLTRSTDTFIPLRTRIKKATKKEADLFISIHADSHNNKSVNGGSVYILSERSSDKEAARLARIANRGDEVAGVILKNEARDIQSILIDLTQRESMNKSALLAQDILKHMGNVVKVKHDKAKFAGFVVLKSPDIPSILVEASYLSNYSDRQILTDKAKQDQLAKEIARGVFEYVSKNY